MEEDPVLYQKLSKVIDEAIKAYLERRLNEEEYLHTVLDAWKETKEQGSSKVPAELRSNPDAKAFFRLLQEGFQKVAGEDRDDIVGIAAETAFNGLFLLRRVLRTG